MHFFLFDDIRLSEQLKPFTFTRPVAHIRVGIFTSEERWKRLLNKNLQIVARPSLQEIWPATDQNAGIWINAAWVPTEAEASIIVNLPPEAALVKGGILLAYHSPDGIGAPTNGNYDLATLGHCHNLGDAEVITRPWEIFSLNGKIIRSDFEWVSKRNKTALVTDPFTRVYGKENVFVEEGADIKAAIINAEEGPVYIGKNAQIQEGSILKGPIALLESSVVNMGAKIRPDTTIGPFCKVGGEINNCVFFGYSNKAHDGFLGNSVIGEWCNLGADTNNSNLKNNYSSVKVYGYAEEEMIDTGLQFCGLLMGDHSKTGINSMLNTGTVIGIASNIFDGGFPPKHILSFSWGGARDGFELFRFDKFLEAEARVYARRKKEIDPAYIRLLQTIYEDTKPHHLP